MLCRTLQRGLLHTSQHLKEAAALRHTGRLTTASPPPPSAAAAAAATGAAAPAAARMSTAAAAVGNGACTAGLLLAAEEDKYDGIIIDHQQLPADPTAFGAALEHSLQVWSQQGKHGVWLKVPRELSQLIPVAVAPGFTFHHAEQDYVMMTKWLPPTPNTLPPNASHQVGVGAIVVDSQGRVLVVQEANGPLRGQGVWKMPTGLVHQGEDIIEAVEREVLEETGVEVAFESVIAVRQAHGFAFGKSDLFFCCGCRVVGKHTDTKHCEREIAALSWITFEEYMAQPFFSKLPLAYHTMMASCQAWAEGRYSGLQGRVFEGTVARPRRDLLLWSSAADGDGGGVCEAAAGAASVGAGSNGNGKLAAL